MLVAKIAAIDSAVGLSAEEHTDPALLLTRSIDQAARGPRTGTTGTVPRRIAGLIPTATGPMPEDMRAALTQRQQLIEQTALHLTRVDLDARAVWTTYLGAPGRDPRRQAEWLRQAVTVHLYRQRHGITGPVYRQRHGITGPAPLGNPKDIRRPEQADEYRTARSALDRARHLSNQSHNDGLTRANRLIDRRHRVDF